MSQTRFSRVLFALLAWSLLLALPQSAPAAPRLTSRMRAPVTSQYDEAAQALGFSAWGETQRSEQSMHVLVRLGSNDTLIGIHLPRTIPAGRNLAARSFGRHVVV
jgi:hypothetical protein